MLVKAKWNVRDAAGWHRAGEVFHTDEDLGIGVEVLDAPKQPKPEPPVEEREPEAAEVPQEESKPKTASRRKTTRK